MVNDTAIQIPSAAAPSLPEPPPMCANCGAPQLGPFCYACGQTAKGPVRYLPEVLEDLADLAFNVDSRIFRSLWDLYLRPGYMTVQYFAGHRARYVSPFRLFFFLCIIAFLAIQLSLGDTHFNLETGDSAIAKAQTPAEVRERTDAAIAALEAGAALAAASPEATAKLAEAKRKLQEEAAGQAAWLEQRDAARAAGEVPPPNPIEPEIPFEGTPWDTATHPVQITWLPDFANARLTAMGIRARENLVAARRDPSRLIAGLFSVSPQTLFVLMPLFAVLLKIVYVFKRRLYMEHLIVALHSHAFIFQSLLLIVLVEGLRGLIVDAAPPVHTALGYLTIAAWIWLPIYLLVMQKRVYRQGWWMTVIKYCFIGWCYSFLVGFGLLGALLVSLTMT
jgi:hypothetical protein